VSAGKRRANRKQAPGRSLAAGVPAQPSCGTAVEPLRRSAASAAMGWKSRLAALHHGNQH